MEKEIRCVETGEVWTSEKECAKSLGVHYNTFRSRCSLGKDVNGLHFRKTGNVTHGMKKPIRNLDTGEIYESVNDAASKLYCTRSCIQYWMKHNCGPRLEFVEGE